MTRNQPRTIWEPPADLEPERCEVCGGEGHPFEIEIFHRGCRLKNAFPNAHKEKDGMLFFDPARMKENIKTLADHPENT